MAAVGRFFPRALIEALERDPAASEPIALPGTCLFADVSGFTAMSEALLGMGKEGSEVLTKVLNGFYARVVRTVLEHGGDVMRFAGDAVTAHFPEEASAVRAAHAMQAILPDFAEIKTPAGTFTLKMKAGLASGTAVLFTVGDDQQKDYVYSGDPVDGSAEAEHHAQAGQVVLRRGGSFEVLETISQGMLPAISLPKEAKSDEALRPFLHPMLWEALSSGQEGYLNEHRNITIIFASFAPMAASGDPIQGVRDFYLRAVESVGSLDGYINKVDMGDKGSKLLILFGTPRAHEDNEVRALLCARKLLEAAKETGFSLRIGLNAARVFCGIVGSSERCEYTVMGDGVNVAARLMQSAPEGQCLTSHILRERAQGMFTFRELPPLKLKGKSEPMPVVLLENRKGADEDIAFIIGRDCESKEFQQTLATQPKDRTGLFIIFGSAGVGKTTFVKWFITHHLIDHRLLQYRCASHSSNIPYSAFRSIGPMLSGGSDPISEAKEIIEKSDPEILDYLPILFNAFSYLETPTPEPALEPEIRRSLLWKMVALLLADAVNRSPLVLFFDGVQWLDGESRALVDYLAQMMETDRLKIILAQREAVAASKGDHLLALGLLPFTETETVQYLSRLLSLDDVPVEAIRKVQTASRGNPLLAKEALSLLFKSGYLTRDDEFPMVLLVDESKSIDLPDSIGGLVLSQLDSAPLAERMILRTLSVVGEHIPQALAEGIGLDLDRLHALARENTFLSFEESDRQFHFSQAHMVPAIYDSMEYSSRREIHERIARWYQVHASKDDFDTCYTLANHFGRAYLLDAVPYLLEVARRAKASLAIGEAIQSLEQAIALSKSNGVFLIQETFDVCQLLLLAGRADEALKLLDHSAGQWPISQKAVGLRLLAETYLSLGQFHRAESSLREALEVSFDSKETFLALCQLGKLLGRTGQVGKAKEVIERVEKEYQSFSSHKEFKMNKMRLAFMAYQQGDAREAITTFLKLKRHFETHGEVTAAYTIGNNLGYLFAEMGQSRKAYSHFLGAFHLVKKYSIWEPEIYLSLLDNLGNQLMQLGEWQKAETYFKQDLAYSRRRYPVHLFKPLYLLGEVEMEKGNLGASVKLLNEAMDKSMAFDGATLEVLEQMLNLYLILANETLFWKSLKDYEVLINANSMTNLSAEVENFRAEGSLLFGDPLAHIEQQIRNLDGCLEESQYPDAFRAARFLLMATKDSSYLKALQQILEHCSKKKFHLIFHHLEYMANPTRERKAKLLRIVRRYPYADASWRALLSVAVMEIGNAKRRRLKEAMMIVNAMMLELDPMLVESFMNQQQSRLLFQMGEGLAPHPGI